MAKLAYVIGAVLLLFWVIGFVFKYIVSPLIHLALIIGIAVLVFRFFQDVRDRRAH